MPAAFIGLIGLAVVVAVIYGLVQWAHRDDGYDVVYIDYGQDYVEYEYYEEEYYEEYEEYWEEF